MTGRCVQRWVLDLGVGGGAPEKILAFERPELSFPKRKIAAPYTAKHVSTMLDLAAQTLRRWRLGDLGGLVAHMRGWSGWPCMGVVVEAAQGMARWHTIHDGNRQWVRTHFSGLLGDGSSPRAQRGEAPPPRSGAFRKF